MDCIQDGLPYTITSAHDNSYKMASLARERVDLAYAVVGIAGHFPFSDNHFPQVVCVKVLDDFLH